MVVTVAEIATAAAGAVLKADRLVALIAHNCLEVNHHAANRSAALNIFKQLLDLLRPISTLTA